MQSSYEIFNKVIKIALSSYWNHPEYEDMYQECYLKVLDVLAKNTYEPIYNLEGYVYRIARNTISNYIYKYKKRPLLINEDYQEVRFEESFLDNLVLEEVFTLMLKKHSKLLPKNYTFDDMYKLITLPDPQDLQMRVVKGDTLWTLASYLGQKN